MNAEVTMKNQSSTKSQRRLWLCLRLCRVWWFATNAAAGAFMAGVVAFTVYLRLCVGLRDVIEQIIPPLFDFYYPTITVFSITSAGHLFLSVRFSQPWWRSRRHTAKVSFTPVVPTTRLIPSSAVRRAYMRLANWVDRHKLEITKVRMLIEVALQTFQANKTSQLVAKRWINNLMAVVLICNCWFSLVIQAMMRSYPAAVARIARLVVDSLLDVTYCLVIPLSIFAPHYRVYTSIVPGAPVLNYYIDTWYANTTSEIRHILMTSWIDCVSKCWAALMMLYRMLVIDQALTNAMPQYQDGTGSNAIRNPKKSSSAQLRVRRFLDAMLFVSGVVVAGLYFQTAVVARHASNVKCLLEMRPWATYKYTCAVLEVNCAQQHTLGDRYAMQAAIERVDANYVQVLVISNCPTLNVPPALQHLRALRALKIYNSTIASWEADAALTDSSHPLLGLVLFPRVNMTGIPAGLLASDFPRSVWDIELSSTNLTTLPEEISTWSELVLLVMEGNRQIKQIPSAALRLPRLRTVVVASNSIENVDDDAFDGTAVTTLIIDANPLKRLPRSASKLAILGISGTLVTELPLLWSNLSADAKQGTTYARAGGTPLCESHGELGIAPNWMTVDCSAVGPRAFGYPMNDEDAWRATGVP